jgi:hypothetical protein
MDPPPEARLTPDPTEPAEVPRKKAGWPKGKKHSPEAIAKLKATLAAKRKASIKKYPGTKIDFIRAHMDKTVPEVMKLAKAQGISITVRHVYATRSQIRKQQSKGEKRIERAPKSEARSRANGAPAPSELSMTQLLDVIAKATAEVQRRLSQLTL